MVKVAVSDLYGTLVDEESKKPVAGALEMIKEFESADIKVYIASNHERDAAAEAILGLPQDRFLYKDECGAKGTKQYMETAMTRAGVTSNEIVYMGNTEWDMREAANSRVAYFNAEWVNPGYEYGLPMDSPQEFSKVVIRFMHKAHPWFYAVDDKDGMGRPVFARAVLNADAAIEEGIRDVLKGWRKDFKVDGMMLSDLLSFHLLGSLYAEGIHLRRKNDKPAVWCVYPGSDGAVNPILRAFQHTTARMLKANYIEKLLVRHTSAKSQKEIRKGGGTPTIDMQVNTIMVNPDLLSKIAKRTVFLVDDFTTGSNAFEASRNLLLAAGAGEVLCMAVAKYGGSGYQAYHPKKPGLLPKGGVAKVTQDDFVSKYITGTTDSGALVEY